MQYYWDVGGENWHLGTVSVVAEYACICVLRSSISGSKSIWQLKAVSDYQERQKESQRRCQKEKSHLTKCFQGKQSAWIL